MIKILVLFLFVFSSSFCKQTRSVEIPDVTIKENIKTGSTIAEKSQYMPATNSDNNETWFYSIKKVYTQKQDNQIEVKDLFLIDIYSGNIRTNRNVNFTLDCAGNCYCILNVLVGLSKNLNSDNIRAVKIVRIKVDDVNNNFPVFSSNLTPVEIPEDSKVGSLFNINQYKASDADCNKN